MKARDFDARRLDVRAFAKLGGQLAGFWPIAGFERMSDLLAATEAGSVAGEVQWTARGEEVPVRAGAAQVWLHLHAQAELPMLCQRCLLPVVESQVLDRRILFVADEETAAELDAETEHDVLVFSKELDLHQLLEDELLLDLPLVPRHDVCPSPLPVEAERPGEPDRHNPFASLSALRRDKG